MVRVEARTTPARAACPGCGCWSGRTRGSYLRFPRDLPAAGKVVVVSLRVRRFVCVEDTAPARRSPSKSLGSLAGSVDALNDCDRRWCRSDSRSQAGRAPA
ncbi:transposase family protein [Streptomyces prasinus]|uniref:transposase family protein n=1 Tax=Streptomyces TaxID=1883 RepID=UPI003319A491